jgi:hypothetical protein
VLFFSPLIRFNFYQSLNTKRKFSMSESMDAKAGASSKEKGYAEQGSKEPSRAAQAVIAQAAAWAAKGGKS